MKLLYNSDIQLHDTDVQQYKINLHNNGILTKITSFYFFVQFVQLLKVTVIMRLLNATLMSEGSCLRFS